MNALDTAAQSNFRVGDRVTVQGVLEMMPGGSSTTLGVRVSKGVGGLLPIRDCFVVSHAATLAKGDTVTHPAFTRGEVAVIESLVNEKGLPSGIPTKALLSSETGAKLLSLEGMTRVQKAR